MNNDNAKHLAMRAKMGVEMATTNFGKVAEGMMEMFEGQLSLVDQEGDSVSYSQDLEELQRDVMRGGRDITEQISYLQGAMEYYGNVRTDLVDPIRQMIEERLRVLQSITDTRRRSREIVTAYENEIMNDDPTFGVPKAVRACAGRDAQAASEREAGRCSRIEGFHVFSKEVDAGDIRSLQNRLMEMGLLEPCEGCVAKDPLLALLGMRGHGLRRRQPMVWMGKINQLHYLINELYEAGVIVCADGRKWQVASQLFIDSRTGRLFTSRQLTKATKINYDDEQIVKRCIPKSCRRKEK
ncbi:MAG: hypothetical protein IJ620_02650 [Bacteroidales bacterium]|nr:hypothetical protein [Bacteroidales bacterium]